MTPPTCSRTWQVEAIRDRRLSGKDVALAEHHQEHCNECAAEARRLGQLTRRISSLPELTRDPLTVRRSRQRLISALNDSLLASPAKRPRRWAVGLAVLPAAAVGYALFFGDLPQEAVPASPSSAVEVRAKPGARWVARSSPGLVQIELSTGEASFTVHPHPGRRVLIRVPDGELEDRGTTFEVTVDAQHTSHIAVSEGRVAVRLADRPEFDLSAGEQWLLPSVASVEPASSSSAPSNGPGAPAAPHLDARRIAPASHRAAVDMSSSAAAPSPVPSATADSGSTRAEDAAYLAVVSSLRSGRFSEARQQAKAYLLRFPNGFRRVEMLNVATSPDREPATE